MERVFIMFAIGIPGLFLTLVMVPFLFISSFINWKNNSSSWKLQLILVFVVEFIGHIMELSFSIFALLIFPLNWIVFSISSFITLIASWKTNPKSSFFLILLGITIISIAFTVFTLATFSP